MKYKIHTTPIWDAFKENTECPMCFLKKSLSARLTDQYLNEAVMLPDYRVLVNKYGFCPDHLKELSDGDNICGLSLQCQTRLESLKTNLKRPKSIKEAKKEAESIVKQLSGCVICAEIEKNMQRYYETAAAMFYNEREFEDLIRSSKGFCLSHYARMLENVSHARSMANTLADVLYNRQFANMTRLGEEIQDFIDMYDSQKPKKMNVPRDATARVIQKIQKN